MRGIRAQWRRVREDTDFLWWFLFTGAFVASVAGTIVVLGGLAAVTNFCIVSTPIGVGAGIKLSPATLAVLSQKVIDQQRPIVTNPNGSFNCGRFFRWSWTLWAMQFAFLCILGGIWYARQIRRFQVGLATLAAVVTAWHMERTDYVVSMEPWTTGDLHTDGMVIGFGLICCAIANFSLMFFAGPYSERELRAPASSTATSGKFASFNNGTDGSQESPRVPKASQVVVAAV